MFMRVWQRGFTLVELIISLLILSVVMVLCASGFRFGTRVWNSINTHSEQIDTIQAVQGFIRNSVSNALVYDRFIQDEEEAVENLFIGNSERIKFVSSSPAYGVDDYLYEYELYLDRAKKQLSLKYRPYNKPTNSPRSESVSTLVEGVEDIQIEYFGGFETEQGNDWAKKWNGEFILPLLVKINLTLKDSQYPWPELVIQMRNGPYVIR